jgi:hypothetical protein
MPRRFRIRRRLARVAFEQPITTRSAGVRPMARKQGQADKSWDPLSRQVSTGRRTISRWKRGRGADEAVVSDDPAGQYNPQASQGPLGGCVRTDRASTPARCGACPLGYSERDRKELGRHISLKRRRLPSTTRLKPYWGKPAVRNFREEEGNVMHGLMAICHEARKGGYDGSHWSNPRRAFSLLDCIHVQTLGFSVWGFWP